MFDIHVYGAGVINEFEKRTCRSSKSYEIMMSHSVTSFLFQGGGKLRFQDIVHNRKPFEVSRTFAATLQLVSIS